MNYEISFVSLSTVYALHFTVTAVNYSNLYISTLNQYNSDNRYLIRPSPFSAQKTFERHNSRRKSNISLCGDTRRRSTTFARPPPLTTAPKSNSLSLPDSPQISPGTYVIVFCVFGCVTCYTAPFSVAGTKNLFVYQYRLHSLKTKVIFYLLVMSILNVTQIQ